MKGKILVHFIVAVLAVVVITASAEPVLATEGELVLDLVVGELLDHRTDGKRVYLRTEPLPAGSEVETWHRTVFTAPSEGWLVFIDDMGRANFEHPCRYVFVDRETREMTVHRATTPPLHLERYHELDTELKRISDAVPVVRPVPYSGPKKTFPNSRGGNSYAVLLSGGADQYNNHIRYYNDTTFMLTTLKEVYGFVDNDIYVLMSDGTDPAPDRSDGLNSPPDLDGDGVDDIDGPCTLAAIESVFDELGTFVTAADQVFIFTTDHGGSESGWDVYLNLWGEEMNDEVLAGHMNDLPAAQFIVTMEQCFSGGFEDDLQTTTPRIFSSAASYTEYSWAMSDLIYDEYVYYWISAVRGEDPYGTPVDADTNGDSQVTMDEAFAYAEAHDTASETPQFAENPAGLGAISSLEFGDRGTLDGTVTEQGSGAPVSALIEAYRQSVGATYSGSTDPGTGDYALGLPVDTYDITASAFGYLPATVNDVDVLIDTTTTQNFTLTPAATGTIQGTVSDEGGGPLSGVEVNVLGTPVTPVYTNGSGFYTVDLPGGDSYDLSFSLSGYASATETAIPVTEGGSTTRDVTLPDWYRILIWEPDPTPVSGTAMQDALSVLGWDAVIASDLFAYPNPLTDYDAIFALVGIYSNNWTFSSGSAEETALTAYLDAGGNLYMEGGDVWCFDSYPATLRGYFNIIDEGDGSGDLSTASGVAGTFTEGMSFAYGGENSWIDQLGAASPAFEIFTNPADGYGCGVAHDAGGYRTIAASYEFGGLADGASPSTKEELMAAYLEFFGLAAGNPDTLLVSLECVPDSGVLPFGTHIYVSMESLVGDHRRLAGSLGITLASGMQINNFRAGFTNLSGYGVYATDWVQNLPALGTLVGSNEFRLEGMDVTPAPYNQPPYAPSGDTDTASRTVVGIAP